MVCYTPLTLSQLLTNTSLTQTRWTDLTLRLSRSLSIYQAISLHYEKENRKISHKNPEESLFFLSRTTLKTLVSIRLLPPNLPSSHCVCLQSDPSNPPSPSQHRETGRQTHIFTTIVIIHRSPRSTTITSAATLP